MISLSTETTDAMETPKPKAKEELDKPSRNIFIHINSTILGTHVESNLTSNTIKNQTVEDDEHGTSLNGDYDYYGIFWRCISFLI